MIVEELEGFLISRSASIRDAMELIDENASGIVLVTGESNRLAGTVTDGDIRRAILEGAALDEPVDSAMTSDPFYVTQGATARTLRKLSEDRGVRQIPIVDDDREVQSLYLLYSVGESPGSDSSGEIAPGRAVVMAGGLGTRLRPHTEDTPKPLVEVGGKPILERIVEHLSEAGIEKVYITTRYLADQIVNYFEDGSDWGVQIEYVHEEKRLGTAGGLKKIDGALDTPTLVMNGDLVTDFNVNEMFRFHRDQDAIMTMGVRHYEMKVPYGVAELDGIEITSLSEKPEFDFFVNAGVYVVEPDVVEFIPSGEYFDLTTLAERIMEEHEVVGFPIVERWLDIGRPEDLERANRKLEE